MKSDERETATALRLKGCTYVGQTADGVHYWEHEQARRFHACARVPGVWADTTSHLATAKELENTKVTDIVALPSVIAGYQRSGILPKHSHQEATPRT